MPGKCTCRFHYTLDLPTKDSALSTLKNVTAPSMSASMISDTSPESTAKSFPKSRSTNRGWYGTYAISTSDNYSPLFTYCS